MHKHKENIVHVTKANFMTLGCVTYQLKKYLKIE